MSSSFDRQSTDQRQVAAEAANAEDAQVWRWFSDLLEDGRLRWCRSAAGWLVTVDHKHLATSSDFDDAIRVAKRKATEAARVKESRV